MDVGDPSSPVRQAQLAHHLVRALIIARLNSITERKSFSVREFNVVVLDREFQETRLLWLLAQSLEQIRLTSGIDYRQLDWVLKLLGLVHLDGNALCELFRETPSSVLRWSKHVADNQSPSLTRSLVAADYYTPQVRHAAAQERVQIIFEVHYAYNCRIHGLVLFLYE